MAKNSFILYYNHREIFDELNDEEAGKLIKAIFAYEIDGILNEDRFTRMVMIPIKQVLDDNREKYEMITERNKLNGKKGGRPKKEENPNNPVGFLETQRNPKNLDIDIDIDIVNDNIDSNNIKYSLKPKDSNNSCCSNNIAHARDNDDDIFSYYEKNFGHTIASKEFEELNYWKDKFEEDVIKYAIDQSVMNDARNMNYLKSILSSYKQKGLKNLEMIMNNEKKFKNKKKSKNNFEYPEPEWMENRYLMESENIENNMQEEIDNLKKELLEIGDDE